MLLNILIKLSFVIINCFQQSIQCFKNKYNPMMIYKLPNGKLSREKFYSKTLLYNNNNKNNNKNDYFHFIKKQENVNSTIFQNTVTVNNTHINIKNDNSSYEEINNIRNLNNIYDFTNFLKHKND